MKRNQLSLPGAGRGRWLKGPVALLTAAIMLMAATIPASADDGVLDSATSDSGITSFGIVSTTISPNISFTVPLYVTLAVLGDDGTGAANTAAVYEPAAGSYRLSNTGEAGYIAVNGVKTEKLGGTWALKSSVTAAGSADGNAMKLTLGGLDLGNVDASNDTSEIDETALLASAAAAFVENNKLKPIPSMGANPAAYWSELEMAGTVNSNWAAQAAAQNDAAAAQWRITYNVVRVDENGNRLYAYTYSGAAENYIWNPSTHTFTTEGVNPTS